MRQQTARQAAHASPLAGWRRLRFSQPLLTAAERFKPSTVSPSAQRELQVAARRLRVCRRFHLRSRRSDKAYEYDECAAAAMHAPCCCECGAATSAAALPVLGPHSASATAGPQLQRNSRQHSAKGRVYSVRENESRQTGWGARGSNRNRKQAGQRCGTGAAAPPPAGRLIVRPRRRLARRLAGAAGTAPPPPW